MILPPPGSVTRAKRRGVCRLEGRLELSAIEEAVAGGERGGRGIAVARLERALREAFERSAVAADAANDAPRG